MGKTRNFDGDLAVHITTAKIRDAPANEVALGHLGHPGQIGVGWVPQNDVTMEAVRADDYFPIDPVYRLYCNLELLLDMIFAASKMAKPCLTAMVSARPHR